MSKRSLSFTLASSLVTLFVAFMPAVAGATESPDGSGSGSNSGTGSHSDRTNETEHSTTTEHSTETENQTSDTTEHSETEHPTMHALAKTHLESAKLKVCQAREHRVKTITGNSATRAQNQLELFTKIATRVEAFYTNKGKTVANYDALVAAVNAAKDKAQADITVLKGMDTFKCDGDDPKGQIQNYRAALEQVRQDLKDYRTAVKNLIVAVKSAQGEESSND